MAYILSDIFALKKKVPLIFGLFFAVPAPKGMFTGWAQKPIGRGT